MTSGAAACTAAIVIDMQRLVVSSSPFFNHGGGGVELACAHTCFASGACRTLQLDEGGHGGVLQRTVGGEGRHADGALVCASVGRPVAAVVRSDYRKSNKAPSHLDMSLSVAIIVARARAR